MNKFKNLDKSWKEILFAASGFGPNLLMVIMGAYFTDAINPASLDLASNADKVVQTITGSCLIIPALFSILWFVSKVFDGLIDVPFASLTDNLKSPFGKRRTPIAICFIPMVLSFVLCWIPISETNMLANTIWIFAWSLVFFSTYTMSLISFYGSLSSVCYDSKQQVRVSSLKSFFDTISYVIAYALVPLILSVTGLHIDKLVFILVPLMLTMLIPLFMIKEGTKWEKKAKEMGYDIVPAIEEKPVKLFESIKLTFTNKPFIRWCVVNCCAFFALQMFLVSMNALILGGMGLGSLEMAILNTCAFAPVPVMLYLFRKLSDKKGLRFAFQTCLLSFAVSILSFVIGNSYISGDNYLLKMIVGIVGSIIGSWAIGSFFMLPYLIPAKISTVEEKILKKNHSAMFFAVQALTTSFVGAVASSLVYENIKTLFISKDASGIVSAIDTVSPNGTIISAAQNAALKFNVSIDSVYNLGTLLVPIIVSICCVIGFVLAFRMPKKYSPKEVSYMLGLEKEYEANKDLFPEEKEVMFEEESLITNNALWVLSGTIFAPIWYYHLINAVNTFASLRISKIHLLISILFFPYGIYLAIKLNDAINEKMNEMNIKSKDSKVLLIVFSLCGLSCVALSILQFKLNKIAKIQNK